MIRSCIIDEVHLIVDPSSGIGGLSAGLINDKQTPRSLVFINNKVHIESAVVITVVCAVTTNNVPFNTSDFFSPQLMME